MWHNLVYNFIIALFTVVLITYFWPYPDTKESHFLINKIADTVKNNLTKTVCFLPMQSFCPQIAQQRFRQICLYHIGLFHCKHCVKPCSCFCCFHCIIFADHTEIFIRLFMCVWLLRHNTKFVACQISNSNLQSDTSLLGFLLLQLKNFM